MSQDWIYPVDPEKDYRGSLEDRLYGFMAWVEANYASGDVVHPVAVLMDSLPNQTFETRTWAAFLWGACYNVIGPYTILSEFPEPPINERGQFRDWYNHEFDRFRVDTDCRYRKSKMIPCVESYLDWLGAYDTSHDKFMPLLQKPSATERYDSLHKEAMSWKYFGRLSVWNYLEGLDIALKPFGHSFDCMDFLLTDLEGSESNRNGLCCATGNEALLTKHGKYLDTKDKMDAEVAWELNQQAEYLFDLADETLSHRHEIKRLSLETCFCWWKKKFTRVRDSRYLGWFADSTLEEIRYLEKAWPELSLWNLKKAIVELTPDDLRGRDVDKEKMKVFFETGRLTDVYNFQHGVRW